MSDTGLLTAWSVLSESEHSKHEIKVLPIEASTPAGPVLAGMDEQGRRAVLFPLLPGEACSEDRKGEAVQLVKVKHGGKLYLVALCCNDDLADVFTAFIRDAFERLSSTGSVAQLLIQMLHKWRSLFETKRLAFSVEQEIGLLAELLVLRRVLNNDPDRRIDCWKGPERSQHDFERLGRSIEVKASRAREGRRVSISSVHQLDIPKSWSLALHCYKFAERADGISLNQLVAEIKGMGIPLSAFDTLLLKAGFDSSSHEVTPTRWVVTEERVYDVTAPGFPKITPTSFTQNAVPHGIFDVSYSIDLTNDPPHPLHEEQIRRLYEEFGAAHDD